MALDCCSFVERLCSARIGETFNFYADGERAPQLRTRLADYLSQRLGVPLLLVGEAPGYRGTRVSGIPLTSERQLTGTGPAEATATLVHAALDELGLADQVMLWNVVPTHPGSDGSNRPPTAAEIAEGLPFVRELARGRRVVTVGRLAQGSLGGSYIRHPSHGGARAFKEGLAAAVARRHPGSATIFRPPGVVGFACPAALSHEDLQCQDRRDRA